MSRLALAFAAGFATFVTAGAAAAADYPDPFGSGTDLRTGFSDAADNSDTNSPLNFEAGLRYWYSWGAQNFNVGPYPMSDTDHTQSVEAHFRIDDNSTKTYVKGLGGLSFAIDGAGINSALGTTSAVSDGSVTYAGGDIGYSWLGDGRQTTFGPFAGYMYWNDSPNIGRANYTVGTQTTDFTYNPAGGLGNEIIGPGNSQEDSLDINALRLGLSGKTTFGNAFDVTAELAAVPYAKVHGTLGAFGVPVADNGSFSQIQSSVADINGWGYGAMGEVMFGFHPTDNITLRLGGRAWYLQGKADTTFDTIIVTDAATPTVVGSQRYIYTANPWSLFRYGALGELSFKF